MLMSNLLPQEQFGFSASKLAAPFCTESIELPSKDQAVSRMMSDPFRLDHHLEENKHPIKPMRTEMDLNVRAMRQKIGGSESFYNLSEEICVASLEQS